MVVVEQDSVCLVMFMPLPCLHVVVLVIAVAAELCGD